MDPAEPGRRASGNGSVPIPGLQHSTSLHPFSLAAPGAELGSIPETEDAETTPAPYRSDSNYPAALTGTSSMQSRPSGAEGLAGAVDTLAPLPLRHRRGLHSSEGAQLHVDPLPTLPSLTIRTKAPTHSEDEGPSEPSQDNEGLLGYLSKGLGGIFGATRPPKPIAGVPGTARSVKSVRSVYSSRSAFHKSVYQEQMHQQMETSVNNFSKFLKDKGHTFKGKMAAATSDAGSNYDAMSAAPDSPFSTVMSTISEWNLPEHTEHATEPFRNPTRLDLSRIDCNVDTKLQLDRYLASQPSPYQAQLHPPSARELEFVPEEVSPAPTTGPRAHTSHFAESPHTRQLMPQGSFAFTPQRADPGITTTPPSDVKSVPLTSPPTDQPKSIHQQPSPEPGAPTTASRPPTGKPAASLPQDINLASHPLAMFAALGSDAGRSAAPSPVEDGVLLTARTVASGTTETTQLEAAANDADAAAVLPSTEEQLTGEGKPAAAEQPLGAQSTVEQQLWHALLAHNQAVIDKQEAEAKAEEATKQMEDLKEQLESSRQQLDSSRAQHSTAAKQVSHLGEGMWDLQAESDGLTKLTKELQQLASSVFDLKNTGCQRLTKAGALLQDLEQQQASEWQDYQALIVSSKESEDSLTQQLTHHKEVLAVTQDELQTAKDEIQDKSEKLEAAVKRGDTLDSDLKQARDQILALTQELESHKEQLTTTRQELSDTKGSLTTCEDDLRTSREEAVKLQHDLEASQAREAHVQSELEASQAHAAQVQSELEASQAHAAQVQSELEASQAHAAQVQSELEASQAHAAQVQSELEASQAHAAQVQSELEASQAHAAQVQSELEASQAHAAQVQSELEASQAREAQLQSDLGALRLVETNLNSDLEASHSRETDLNSNLAASQASESDLQFQLTASQARESALRSELQSITSDLQALSWQDLLQGLSTLQTSQTEVKQKCGELRSFCSELEEDTLSAATNFMEMQEDLNESEDALREIRTDRQALASRCEILKQTNVRLKAEAEETAEELRELRHERQQLTSLREILRQENVALGAQVKKLSEGKEKAEAAEVQLAEHVALLEKQVVASRATTEKLQAAKKQLESDVADLEKQVSALQSESSTHAAAAEAQRVECSTLREQVDTLQTQLSSAHSNMEQLSSKTGALRGAVASISADAACLLELRQQLSHQLSHGTRLTQHLNHQGEQLNRQLSQRMNSQPPLRTPPAISQGLLRVASTPAGSSGLPPLHTPVPPPQPGTPPRSSAGDTNTTTFLPSSTTPTSLTQRSPDAWAPGTPPQVSESMAQAMVQQAELIELLESEVISLQEQVLAAQQQVTSLCSCMNALQADNNNLKELNTSLQEGLSASGAQVAALRDALGQVAEVERELRNVKEGLQGMASQTAQAVSVWPELGEVRMKVVEVETTWQSQLEAAEQLRQRMLSKLTSEQMNVSELTQQLASAESQQRQLAVQVAAAGHLRVELEHELERVRTSNSDLSRELRSAKSANVLLESRVEEAVGELRTVRSELDQAKSQRDRSATDANRLLSQHEDLQRHCHNLKNRCSELAGEVEASRRASRQVQNAVRELQNLKAELHQTEMLCSFLSRCTQTFSSNQAALITDLQPIQQAWVSLLYSADGPFGGMGSNISRGKAAAEEGSDPTFLPLPPARVPDQSQLNLALRGGKELVRILMHMHSSAMSNPTFARAFKQALLQVPMSPRLRRTMTPPSSPSSTDLVRKRSTPVTSPVKESTVSPLSSNDLAVFMKLHLDFDPAQMLKQLDASAATALQEGPSLEQLSADVVAARKLLTTRLQQLLQPLSQHAREWGGSWEELVRMLAGEEGGDNFGQPKTGSAALDTQLQLEQLVAVTLKVLVFLCKQAAQQASGQRA